MRDKFWEIRLLHSKFQQISARMGRRGAVNERLQVEVAKLGGFAAHPTVSEIEHAFLRHDGPVKRWVWQLRVIDGLHVCAIGVQC